MGAGQPARVLPRARRLPQRAEIVRRIRPREARDRRAPEQCRRRRHRDHAKHAARMHGRRRTGGLLRGLLDIRIVQLLMLLDLWTEECIERETYRRAGRWELYERAGHGVLCVRRLQVHAYVLECAAAWAGQRTGELVAELCEGVGGDAVQRGELREARVGLFDEPLE